VVFNDRQARDCSFLETNLYAIGCRDFKLKPIRKKKYLFNVSIRKIFNVSRITNVIARSTEPNLGTPT